VRRFRSAIVAAGIGLSVLALSARANAESIVEAPAAISTTDVSVTDVSVTARPLEAFDLRDRTHRRFGQLQFRSGLVLSSSFKHFGGLSAFRLDARGENFVAVNDRGRWFTGRLVYEGAALASLADVRSAPMLGADGLPITSKRIFDSESLAVDGSTLYVGIERKHRILRFDFGRGGMISRGVEIAVPPAVRRLPNNQGIEGLVFVPKGSPLAGTLIAVSERGLDPSGNLLAFLIGGPRPGQFSVRRTDHFDISDAALLPGGDLLLLERKFSLMHGIGVRVRRIPQKAIAPRATVDGPTIFQADLGHEIDNLEAIDVHVTDAGETVVTMVSDDNFSMLQRTLLLQFTLVE
jgi:hypothetical protein